MLWVSLACLCLKYRGERVPGKREVYQGLHIYKLSFLFKSGQTCSQRTCFLYMCAWIIISLNFFSLLNINLYFLNQLNYGETGCLGTLLQIWPLTKLNFEGYFISIPLIFFDHHWGLNWLQLSSQPQVSTNWVCAWDLSSWLKMCLVETANPNLND